MNNLRNVIFFCFIFLFTPMVVAWEVTPLSESFYGKINEEYGGNAEQRFRDLQALLLREDNRPRNEELTAVNDFLIK